MKRTEKTDKILAKYKQYLKLEKSLSDNTVDAYLTDLDKLLAYLTLENYTGTPTVHQGKNILITAGYKLTFRNQFHIVFLSLHQASRICLYAL